MILNKMMAAAMPSAPAQFLGFTTANSNTITLPTGLVAGDIVIVGISISSSETTTPSSTGWTKVFGDFNYGSRTTDVCYAKTMGSVPDTTFAITSSSGTNIVMLGMAFRTRAYAYQYSQGQDALGTRTDSIDPAIINYGYPYNDGGMLLSMFFQTDYQATTVTWPNPLTPIGLIATSSSNGASVAAAYYSLPAGSSSIDIAAVTTNTSGRLVYSAFLLQPS